MLSLEHALKTHKRRFLLEHIYTVRGVIAAKRHSTSALDRTSHSTLRERDASDPSSSRRSTVVTTFCYPPIAPGAPWHWRSAIGTEFTHRAAVISCELITRAPTASTRKHHRRQICERKDAGRLGRGERTLARLTGAMIRFFMIHSRRPTMQPPGQQHLMGISTSQTTKKMADSAAPASASGADAGVDAECTGRAQREQRHVTEQHEGQREEELDRIAPLLVLAEATQPQAVGPRLLLRIADEPRFLVDGFLRRSAGGER